MVALVTFVTASGSNPYTPVEVCGATNERLDGWWFDSTRLVPKVCVTFLQDRSPF